MASVTFGEFLSCEERTPARMAEQAAAAQRAGFDALWISDHFHPSNDEALLPRASSAPSGGATGCT